VSEQLIRQFVDLLYPPEAKTPGYFSIWELPGRRSYHFKPSDPELEIAAHALDNEGHNVFYGVGLRRADLGAGIRGSKPDICALPGFWVDIDIAGGHAAKNLPQNIVDVIRGILQPFDWEPSAIVNSGGGVHAYWLFDRPLELTDDNREEVAQMSKAFQQRLGTHAIAAGWHFDTTSDLPRVLRPVGTNNRKTSMPRPVNFMGTPGKTRYPFSLFQSALKTRVAPASKASKGPPVQVPVQPADTRTEDQVLDQLRSNLRRNRKKDRAETVERILEGQPFAEPGDRDRMLQRVCSWIAWYDSAGDPEILAQVLISSLEQMEAMAPEGAMTFEDAVSKISRAQGDARRKKAETQGLDDRIKKALISQARGLGAKVHKPAELQSVPLPPSPDARPAKGALPEAPPPDKSDGGPVLSLVAQLQADAADGPDEPGPYTSGEMDVFAARQSELSGNSISPEGWKKRWVITYGDTVYIFRNGRYLSPLPMRNFALTAHRDLHWVLPHFDENGDYYYSPQTATGDGALRYKKPDEVLREIGTVARKIVADMSIAESFYDENTETFYEAVCPLRADISPRFDESIDRWLRILSGEDTDKLLDWIATVTYLQAPSCGLIMSGPPAVGKSLLANGLARLWHSGGYTRMDDVVGSFNADVASCPLVVADEALPEGPNGKPISTKRLRDIISSDTRALKRKFMANAPLKGTVRCMFLANSDRMLDLGDETLGADSMAAVASRFLHIETTKDASDFIESIGGRPGGTKDWVNGDLIARHALWLRDNRDVIPDGRFWVQGHVSKMHKMLSTASTVNGMVVEWLVKYLTRAKPDVMATFGVLVGNGELWVNTAVLSEYWQEYIKNRGGMTPPVGKIARALEALSAAPAAIRIRTPKGQKRYWPLRTETILEWSKESGVGDPIELQEVLNTPVPGGFNQLA
jgi:hypothetical protein